MQLMFSLVLSFKTKDQFHFLMEIKVFLLVNLQIVLEVDILELLVYRDAHVLLEIPLLVLMVKQVLELVFVCLTLPEQFVVHVPMEEMVQLVIFVQLVTLDQTAQFANFHVFQENVMIK